MSPTGYPLKFIHLYTMSNPMSCSWLIIYANSFYDASDIPAWAKQKDNKIKYLLRHNFARITIYTADNSCSAG